MSVLVDTGVLVAFLNERDARHARAKELVEALMGGRHGTPFVSDYILDEAYTLLRVRTGRLDLLSRLWDLLRFRDREGLLVLEFLTPEDFWATVDMLADRRDQPLSFTDGTSLTLLRRMGLDGIVSFDDDFDGLATRLA